ncbi:heme-copper oxidase subunit III [Haloferax sp. S1W]|uniref:heme-copper oxidase subunit III n=1 Tax=Haloferax sp. S1W TaxID=3377110 RepID=UPI0037CBD53A
MGESESNVGEPVRRGAGAEGFPHGSRYPVVVGLGLLLLGWGLLWPPVLIAGVPVMLYGLWGWTREYAIEEFEAGVVPEQKRQLLGIETGLFGMYVLIVSEILVFMGFFVAWFYLDATRGPFPPEGYPGLTLWLGAAMTGAMVLGSLALYYGRTRITAGDRTGVVRGFSVGIVAGVAFFVLLGVEYAQLMAGDLFWSTGPYGAAYYALTGLHAAHLAVGVVLVGIVVYRARVRNHFSENRNLMVRTVEAYWHFLTAVSLAILTFVYFGT